MRQYFRSKFLRRSSSSSMMPYHSKVIVDTDGGVDDAIGILLALDNLPSLLGITTVFGNVSQHQAHHNVQQLLNHLPMHQHKTKLYPGATEPLHSSVATPWAGHGPDGFGGVAGVVVADSPPPILPQCDVAAVRHMVDTVNAHPGQVTVVALGPLTNVALSIKADDDFVKNMKQLIFMGATKSPGRGNTTAAAEFNVASDPEAAEIVLSNFSAPKLHIFTWDLCLEHALSWNFFDTLVGHSHAHAKFIESICEHYVAISRHKNTVDGDYSAEDGLFVPCDAYAVAAIIATTEDPYVVESHQVHGSIVLNTESEERGASVFKKLETHEEHLHNATVVHAIDTSRFEQMLLNLVRRRRPNSKSIWIDTDAGVDDALSIMLALESSRCNDVVGISTVHGNVPNGATQASANVTHVLEHLKEQRDLVFTGASVPIRASVGVRWPGHGPDGLGGAVGITESDESDSNEAVDGLIQYVNSHDVGDVTILAIGPLTNIALAFEKDPSIVSKLNRVIFLGSTTTRHNGNTTAEAEFNVGSDPEAAQIVLEHCHQHLSNESPLLLIVPWEICLQHGLDWDLFDKIVQADSANGRFIKSFTRPFEAFCRNNSDTTEEVSTKGMFIPCDTFATMLLLLDEDDYNQYCLSTTECYGEILLQTHCEEEGSVRGASVWRSTSTTEKEDVISIDHGGILDSKSNDVLCKAQIVTSVDPTFLRRALLDL